MPFAHSIKVDPRIKLTTKNSSTSIKGGLIGIIGFIHKINTSTSNIRKINDKIKKGIEKETPADLILLNPHSKGVIFSFWNIFVLIDNIIINNTKVKQINIKVIILEQIFILVSSSIKY
jgi:hypothetical protein